jgi:hypothetical protein
MWRGQCTVDEHSVAQARILEAELLPPALNRYGKQAPTRCNKVNNTED